MDWLGQDRIIPHWLYALDYIRSDGQGGHLPAVRIGECHFSGGCNYGEFLAPDENGNGIPDLFTEITWDSWDYRNNGTIPGYLEHIQHIYIRETDSYSVTKYLYQYTASCKPPLSQPDDLCRIAEECNPTYTVVSKELLEFRHLNPSPRLNY